MDQNPVEEGGSGGAGRLSVAAFYKIPLSMIPKYPQGFRHLWRRSAGLVVCRGSKQGFDEVHFLSSMFLEMVEC